MNYRRWRKATLIGNVKDFIGRKKRIGDDVGSEKGHKGKNPNLK